MLHILLFFSGCCSETEVSEQLYYVKGFIFAASLVFFAAQTLAGQKENITAGNAAPDERYDAPLAWKPPALKLDFPFFDLPHQIDAMNAAGNGFFSSYASPSMGQSMAVSLDVYQAMHFGLKKLRDSLDVGDMWKKAIYYGGTGAGILLFAYIAPFGYPWMHNEYTRSILTQFDINSDSAGGVTNVSDGELERFKKEIPADFVRMNSAGIEGYILFSDKMLRDIFLYDLHNLSNITALCSTWFGAIGNMEFAILDYYGSEDIDKTIIDAKYKNDGGELSRNVYGYPAINWVYELFRPDEPYSARGAHPSGNGVARYIKLSQLSGGEKDYLINQSLLAALNYLSPAFFGFSSIPLGESGFSGNFTVHHYFTSFGTDTPVELMIKKGAFNFMFTYHNYMNYENYFFSVEGEIIDYPVKFTGLNLLFSLRVMIGMQPKDQRFKTDAPELFGLLGLRTDVQASKYFYIFCDITAKTAGWAAGNPYLDKSISIAIGASMRY